MKITVTGTAEEIDRVKNSLEFNCFFDSEFCSEGPYEDCCKECEQRHNFKIEYIEENKQEV